MNVYKIKYLIALPNAKGEKVSVVAEIYTSAESAVDAKDNFFKDFMGLPFLTKDVNIYKVNYPYEQFKRLAGTANYYDTKAWVKNIEGGATSDDPIHDLLEQETKEIQANIDKLRSDRKAAEDKERARKAKFKKYRDQAEKDFVSVGNGEEASSFVDLMKRLNISKKIMKKAASKKDLDLSDWNKLISGLFGGKREEFRNELITSAAKHWKIDLNDPRLKHELKKTKDSYDFMTEPDSFKMPGKHNAASEKARNEKDLSSDELTRLIGFRREILFINYIFNTKNKGQWVKTSDGKDKDLSLLSTRDIAVLWGTSHVYVNKIIKQALDKIISTIAKKAGVKNITSLRQALSILELIPDDKNYTPPKETQHAAPDDDNDEFSMSQYMAPSHKNDDASSSTPSTNGKETPAAILGQISELIYNDIGEKPKDFGEIMNCINDLSEEVQTKVYILIDKYAKVAL